jgi:hypothetical protein
MVFIPLVAMLCLHYTQSGHSNQQKVSTCLKRFMISDWSSHAFYAPHFLHSWEDFSTTCFCQCLTLRRTSEYSRAAKAFQPMTPTILSKDTIVTLHQLHP